MFPAVAEPLASISGESPPPLLLLLALQCFSATLWLMPLWSAILSATGSRKLCARSGHHSFSAKRVPALQAGLADSPVSREHLPAAAMACRDATVCDRQCLKHLCSDAASVHHGGHTLPLHTSPPSAGNISLPHGAKVELPPVHFNKCRIAEPPDSLQMHSLAPHKVPKAYHSNCHPALDIATSTAQSFPDSVLASSPLHL